MSATSDRSPALPTYRPDIDGLRAVAVLAVVGFHAFPQLDPGGFVGVDIFFVISGYLISTIILDRLAAGRFDFLDFYGRRARRIFPALLAVLIACLVAGWLLLLPREFKEFGRHTAAAAAFISNFMLWHESGYFDTSAVAKPLLHLWSLGVEEQFYVLWPLLLVGARQGKGRMLALTVLLTIASFAYSVYATGQQPVAAFFSPVSRWWELMLGSLLAQLMRGRANPGHWRGNAASLAGMFLIAATLLRLDSDQAFPGWWALPPAVGAFLLLLAGPQAWLNRILSNRLLVGCGLISYPLYLWHWPVLTFARVYQSRPISTSATVAAIAVSFGLAWLTYSFIERPIRFGSAFGLPRGRLAPILFFLLTITGSVGAAIYLANGVGFRPVIGQVRAPFVIDYSRVEHKPCPDIAILTPILAAACFSHVNPGAPRKVVLWGDSHAPSWAEDFEALALKDNFELYVLKLDGCPPLTGVRRSDIANSDSACGTLETSRALFDAIVGLHPDVVVMAARWSIFSQGWIRNGRLMPANSFLTTSPDAIATRKTSREALIERIPATIDELKAHKISVVVIRNPPVLRFEITNLRKSIAEIEVTSSENDELSRFTDEIFARETGYELFDAASLLCKERCRAVLDGRELYLDDNHLGVFGARLFEDKIDALMRRVLSARG
jgi:peptidoglycan/LPS O-acetylase OafA/YrhL